VKNFVLALGILYTLTSPVSGEESCIPASESLLIYDPDQPPVCPPLPFEITPSIIGRPHDFTAQILAGCAGFLDAVLMVEPEHASDPQFVNGDTYFEIAKAQRERPSLNELEQKRQNARDWIMADVNDPTYSLGSLIPHSFMGCGTTLQNANTTP
jgi:hypothetical protein